MYARNHDQIEALRRSVLRVRRLSDRAVKLGPFGFGLDGLSAWIPGVGAAYSVGAGGFLLLQAIRARASTATLMRMAAYLVADSLTDLIPLPIVPAVVDMLFTGHKWAADALIKHLDQTLYYPGTRAQAEADPGFREQLAALAENRRINGRRRRRRIVFLGQRAV